MKVGFLACAVLSAARGSAFVTPVAPSVAVSKTTSSSTLRYECLVVVEALCGSYWSTGNEYSSNSTTVVASLSVPDGYFATPACLREVMAGSGPAVVCSVDVEGSACGRLVNFECAGMLYSYRHPVR